MPDPLFVTKIPAGRRSSRPAPLPPGDQPDPQASTAESDVRPLRWVRCPDEGRLHLLAPAEVLRATGRGRAQALCGPTPSPQPAADPWRDAEGTPIPLLSRVEQVVVDTEHGALASRLHQQGQVVGRGTTLVYVFFDHGNQLIALRPHLVRVLETPDGC